MHPVLRIAGTVVKGFGRGSRDLGIPTANVNPESLRGALAEAVTGAPPARKAACWHCLEGSSAPTECIGKRSAALPISSTLGLGPAVLSASCRDAFCRAPGPGP